MKSIAVYLCGALTGIVISTAVAAVVFSIARPRKTGVLITDSTRLALLLFDYEVQLRNHLSDLGSVRIGLLRGPYEVARIDGITVTAEDVLATVERDFAPPGPPSTTTKVKLICALPTQTDVFRFQIADAHP